MIDWLKEKFKFAIAVCTIIFIVLAMIFCGTYAYNMASDKSTAGLNLLIGVFVGCFLGIIFSILILGLCATICHISDTCDSILKILHEKNPEVLLEEPEQEEEAPVEVYGKPVNFSASSSESDETDVEIECEPNGDWYCPKCGTLNRLTENVCHRCGFQMPENE